ALVSAMLARLRAKQYDDALLDAVNFVSSTMRAHAGAAVHTGFTQTNQVRRASQPSWGGIVPILIGLAVVWIVISIVRALFRGSGGYSGGPGMSPMGGGGGGGFLSSMIGGIFGAAAGNWMYDRFFGGRGESSYFGSQPETRERIDQGFSGQDTDYSSSGDSFGGSSSGGGGGDSGGGDSGGGGGDF
ncbi:MAG TPA: hypothetical protein VEO95_02495, partial [Chthoniobacteraceae bacterium]|nr:hypothetical protein [Chthoniobacteraceae bacterium]